MPGSAFPTLTDFVALNKLRASELNTLIDALEALKTWSAQGDLLYGYDADQLEKLTLTPYGLLTAGASVPAWLAPPAGNAILRHSGTAFSWLASTSGAMLYANGSNVPAWLAKPSGASYLTHNGTVPSWSDSVAGTMDASGQASMSAPSTSSTSYADVTGGSVSLTLSGTCTIVVMTTVNIYMSSGSGYATLNLNVNGSADSLEVQVYNTTTTQAVTMTGIFTGIPSGSRTAKLRWKVTTGATVQITTGRLSAIAYLE